MSDPHENYVLVHTYRIAATVQSASASAVVTGGIEAPPAGIRTKRWRPRARLVAMAPGPGNWPGTLSAAKRQGYSIRATASALRCHRRWVAHLPGPRVRPIGPSLRWRAGERGPAASAEPRHEGHRRLTGPPNRTQSGSLLLCVSIIRSPVAVRPS